MIDFHFVLYFFVNVVFIVLDFSFFPIPIKSSYKEKISYITNRLKAILNWRSEAQSVAMGRSCFGDGFWPILSSSQPLSC